MVMLYPMHSAATYTLTRNITHQSKTFTLWSPVAPQASSNAAPYRICGPHHEELPCAVEVDYLSTRTGCAARDSVTKRQTLKNPPLENCVQMTLPDGSTPQVA
jgi:hypothetical protein